MDDLSKHELLEHYRDWYKYGEGESFTEFINKTRKDMKIKRDGARDV